jgi:hypothetical protein
MGFLLNQANPHFAGMVIMSPLKINRHFTKDTNENPVSKLHSARGYFKRATKKGEKEN